MRVLVAGVLVHMYWQVCENASRFGSVVRVRRFPATWSVSARAIVGCAIYLLLSCHVEVATSYPQCPGVRGAYGIDARRVASSAFAAAYSFLLRPSA